MAESKEHAALETREARRHAVQTIAKTISNHREALYEHKDLGPLSIQVLPMPLAADGQPAFKPEYFAPYRERLQDPDEELDFWSSSPEEVMEPMSEALTLCNYFRHFITDATYDSKVGDHNLPMQPIQFRCPLDELEFEEFSIQWCSGGITDTPGGPWMKCLLLESVNANDGQITRGEILCICRIMDTCLRVKKNRAYPTIPVLLVSFVGPRHARILLAHYDGINLVIRQSQRFAFYEKNIPDLKILLRWWCSSGTGFDVTK